MNYCKLYNSIIEKRKQNIPSGYTEEHHILPRCLGGSDDIDNLVLLTAKEHFICHLLLTKIYPKESSEYYKMCHAFFMMLKSSENQQRYITSRKYEKLKVSFSERMSVLQSGENNSQHGTMWIHNKELQQCKKVPKDSVLETGWEIGRVLIWNASNKVIPKKEKVNYKDLTIEMYHFFINFGYNAVVEKYGKRTRSGLLMQFKKYIPDYDNKLLPKHDTKKYIIDGKYFNNIKDAAKYFDVGETTIFRRLKSKKWENYKIIGN